MTALKKYQKLEARGLWRDLPEAQRREVVVSLGDASLVLSDPRSGTAITHWSLPAVLRRNPGGLPAVFAPGADAAETLELDDADMIAALDTVHRAIAAAQPHPGRLRGAIFGAVTVAVVGAAVFWLPEALIAHTARVLPPATRAEIGRMALADLARLTGAPCTAERGVEALELLGERVFGPGQAPELTVVREGVTGALHLPGRQIVLAEALVAIPDGPEVAAGYALAEQMRAEAADPMVPLLRHAGPLAALRLLASGTLPAGAVDGYAETLLAAAPAPLPDAALLARFRAAEVPAAPYAQAVDPAGAATRALIEADPFPGPLDRPLLLDEDWIGLQDICTAQ
jgi:hypothetical protein